MAKNKVHKEDGSERRVERAREEKREGRRRWTIVERGRGPKESVRSGQRAGRHGRLVIPRTLWSPRTHPYLEEDAVHVDALPTSGNHQGWGIEEDVKTSSTTELGDSRRWLPGVHRTSDEFLASLKLKKASSRSAAELKRDGIGYIPSRSGARVSVQHDGAGPSTNLKNKSGHIKNPAIRYAHKVIAHTLFADMTARTSHART
ncbi:unnamed protein product [Microthlaspi erraticum]|uniref:Arabidopsis retrotransposon Orf1 C-terminal domain-containing protein n=1 Tax=Microthlaspi erraticum TaxID=1685480 RepID=A0A6D2HFV3_9BRAS|nr:unnamed protein product [Microthlaspi erraticum]